MILSGKKIHEEILLGGIEIEPFNIEALNPNSYNLKLHNQIAYYEDNFLDMKKENKLIVETIGEDGFMLQPGVLYLGRTVERTFTDKYVPMLEGRSSVGRLGMSIHVTAGFGDIGFNGFWTLEISVVEPLIIYPNIDICQIYYHEIKGEYDLYGKSGKYQNNKGIQPSLIFKDFK